MADRQARQRQIHADQRAQRRKDLLRRARPPKYRNQKVHTQDAGTFDSRREWLRWTTLRDWQACGVIRDLQRQVAYLLHVNGQCIGRYVADFVYAGPENVHTIEDAKGYRTPLYAWKKKHFEAEYGIPITEV